MKTQDAKRYFGSYRKLATALEITTQAVYLWGDTVPMKTAVRIQELTKSKLKLDPRCYMARSCG